MYLYGKKRYCKWRGHTLLRICDKAIPSCGESKSHYEIAALLASRLGIEGFGEQSEEDYLREMVRNSEIPDYETFKRETIYPIKHAEPYVALRQQVEDPVHYPFPTPSGKIEIYSQQWAELDDPLLPPVPKYLETWESRNDPLAKKYPLQLITSHSKRRANSQFENIPWLRELEAHSVMVNGVDAHERGIEDGDLVRVFNDRGTIIIRANVTERIMPGVVDVPTGGWYQADEDGADKGGCTNVLTKDAHSPGGAFTYNTCLVQIEKI